MELLPVAAGGGEGRRGAVPEAVRGGIRSLRRRLPARLGRARRCREGAGQGVHADAMPELASRRSALRGLRRGGGCWNVARRSSNTVRAYYPESDLRGLVKKVAAAAGRIAAGIPLERVSCSGPRRPEGGQRRRPARRLFGQEEGRRLPGRAGGLQRGTPHLHARRISKRDALGFPDGEGNPQGRHRMERPAAPAGRCEK